MSRWFGRKTLICLIVGYYVVISTPAIYANSLQSNNYRFDESSLGSGGLIQSSSANFQAANSAGTLGVGNAASENFQVEAGSQTTNDPTLTFSITNASANFGSFSATSSSVATTTFSVSNYTSYGYVVQIIGGTPKNGTRSIPALTDNEPPQAGTEQFGINLVANTLPSSVGANPNNGQFGFGEVAPNYGISNEYRFVSGETIALAPKSSGQTIYTMSYMVNVAPLTPGGQYKTNQTLIVTGTY